ncbi:M56 family metallopeptidase [Janthinobacterium sp. MDT1-19]|uniref:M56 family metallopeptidase n=1 Tax=Janthinobacterium sp. MDT1-19 TaxID=1259339 RepID=UPI003F21F693
MSALNLLQASAACLLSGLLLQGMMFLAQRRWPALRAQRSVWLGAQLVLASVFALSLLPDSRHVSVVPAVNLPAAIATPAPVTQLFAVAKAAPAMAVGAPQADAPAATAWLSWLAPGWLGIYLLGIACVAWRYWRGRATLRALLKAAQPLDAAALAMHAAFSPAQLQQLQTQGMGVLEIDAPVSAMLVGVWRPRLLLPAHLRQFTPEQQQLVIEHELTHARRRDPLVQWLAALAYLLLWFNPAMRWLGGQLAWAQELACDRHVLAGRPQQQRQQYAAALVRQLSLQTRFPAGLAFGGKPGGMLERVARMRDVQTGAMHWSVKAGLALTLCTLGAASVVLQPALAWTAGESALLAKATDWRHPLASMRVTGFFGVVRPATPKGLRGLDLAASRGTPVFAVADGMATVKHDEWLGKFVRINHGGGIESLYAHLDSVALVDGAVVKAGQTLGTAGATGRATGPHLHFQVRQDGRVQDPQTRLAGLDANASEHALRMRKEQFGR